MKKVLRGVVAAAVAALGLQTQAFVVAERGKDYQCSVVFPADAGKCIKQAARDFWKIGAKRLVGVEMAEVQLPAEVKTKRKVVFSVAKDLKPQAFRITAKPDVLTIEGGDEAGVLYGVYEVLEKFAGIRWYSTDTTKIPKTDRFEVPDGYTDTQEPAFLMRFPFWTDLHRDPVFCARLRVNGGTWMEIPESCGGSPYRFAGNLGSCHTFHKLVPPKEYFKDHPEYFSEVGGRRRGANGENTQLCLSNPDVLKIVTEKVLKTLRENPDAQFVGVSQMDWRFQCECADCKAIDEREGSPSGSIITFVNKVAEAVEKEFPKVKVETLAYTYSRKPPKFVRPRKNVLVCFCSIECDFSHSLSDSTFKENVSFRDDMKKWSEITDELYVWDYVTDFNHYPMPMANVFVQRDNIRFFRDNKVKYLFEQGGFQGRYADMAELKAWLEAKLMWNPDQPLEPLLDDFLEGYYGKSAAPFVRKYLNALQKCYADPVKFPLTCYEPVYTKAIPDGFFDRALALWDKAAEASKDEPEDMRRNVRRGAYSILYAIALRREGMLDARSGVDPVKAKANMAKLRTVAKRWLELDKELGKVRLAESLGKANGQRNALTMLAEGPDPVSYVDGGIVIEEGELNITGNAAKCVKDDGAGNGTAIMVPAGVQIWCVTFPYNRCKYDPGAKYKASVRIRCEKKPDPSGVAFEAGIYNSRTAKATVRNLRPDAKDAEGAYKWYELGEFTPDEKDMFWFQPGRYDFRSGKPPTACENIFIDSIKIERAEAK